jgi:predicted MFS family arabinose efflux permease
MQQSRVFTLRVQVMLFMLTRLITDTGYRMVFPFLPVFAQGLSVDVAVLSLCVSLRQTLGIAAPLFGSAADLYGRKAAMLFGLSLFGASYVFFALSPSLLMFVVALLGSGVGKTILDPAVSAYLGDNIRLERRGTAFAIIEFGWAGAFLIGVPATGWLISERGWAAPFPVIGILVFVAVVACFWVLPNVPRILDSPTLVRSLQRVVTHRAALPVLGIGLLICLSNGMVMIIYGVWLTTTFQLTPALLGGTAIVIGLAELIGEGFAAAFADRMNLRRTILVAIGLNAFAALSLPLLDDTLFAALGGLFLFASSFEYVLVCTIPVIIEMVPTARATAMASKTAFQRTGFALGTLLGLLFFPLGMGFVGGASALAALGALLILLFWVHPGQRTPSLSSSRN